MKRLYIIIFCFLLKVTCYGQDYSDFDSLKLYKLTSINYKEDNSDQISVFKNIFSKYNFVILAEPSHYEGATIDAKCMLMKELIEGGIINTIYIESSWLNMQQITSTLLKKGKSGIIEARNYCESLDLMSWVENGFWDYIANKIIDRKVSVIGLDIETTSTLLMQEMFEAVKNLPSIQKLKKTDSTSYLHLKNVYDNFSYYRTTSISLNEYSTQCKFIDDVLKDYKELGDDISYKRWQRIFKYLYWIYHRKSIEGNNSFGSKTQLGTSIFHSIRDSIMAETFLEDYSNRKNAKAIINISAYHTLRNFNDSPELQNYIISPGTHILTDIINKSLGEQIYSICFVTASGKKGLNYLGKEKGHITNIKPTKKSLEYHFRKSPYDFFFTDLQNSTLADKNFVMNIFEKPINAKWGKIFSGVFFIKKMYLFNFLHFDLHKIIYENEKSAH